MLSSWCYFAVAAVVNFYFLLT